MDEPIIAAHLFAIHIVLGVEALDLTGDLRIELFGIAQRDWADAAARLLYALPQCRHIQPQRANRAHACHHDTPFHRPGLLGIEIVKRYYSRGRQRRQWLVMPVLFASGQRPSRSPLGAQRAPKPPASDAWRLIELSTHASVLSRRDRWPVWLGTTEACAEQ